VVVGAGLLVIGKGTVTASPALARIGPAPAQTAVQRYVLLPS
jgi:hypothetical protein